jgi:hypothetical protein
MVEAPGVTLVGVDDDLEDSSWSPGGRQRDVGARLLGGAGTLPEDHFAAPRLGEHELRPVLPATVEHEVDRRTAASAGAHRDALDDVGFVGPRFCAMAVQLGGARPDVADLEDDRLGPERDVHEEWQ